MGLHDGHRQRSKRRYLTLGAEGMEDHQLLELLLFYAIPRQDTNETAHRLIQRFGSLQGVLHAAPEELTSVEGVGENAAVLVRLVGDMALRARCSSLPQKVLNSPDRTGAYFMELLAGEKKEMLYQVCLDAKGKLLTCRCISKGSVAASPGGGERSVRRRQQHYPCPQPPQRRGFALPAGSAGDAADTGGALAAEHSPGRPRGGG